MATKQQIVRFVKKLEALVVVNEDGESVYPDGSPTTLCTSAAKLIAQEFGGRVSGFYAEDNPDAAILGLIDDEAHDFAVVDDRYLIDVYAWAVMGVTDRPVLDSHNKKEAAQIKYLYGDPATWEDVCEYVVLSEPLSATEFAIYQQLERDKPKTSKQIEAATGLSSYEVSAGALVLEIKHLARRLPDGKYVRRADLAKVVGGRRRSSPVTAPSYYKA